MGLDYGELVTARASLAGAPERLAARVRATARAGADDTVTMARRLVDAQTNDTGYLESTIGADIDADGLGFSAGPTASYAVYVEGGDSDNAPQPFMGPAFEATLAATEPRLADDAEAAL